MKQYVCSICGYIHDEIKMSAKFYICEHCGNLVA